jgi:hypothetical protein
MKHNFKVGDKVKVIKKVEKQEGWANSWYSDDKDDDMDSCIGKTFTIADIDNSKGIWFKELQFLYCFPSDSLELVIETKELLTEADITQALLAGETLIDNKRDKYFLNKEKLKFYYLSSDEQEPEELELTAKDILRYKPKIYQEVVEKPWYKNIPEQGRLCWAIANTKKLVCIKEYSTNSDFPYSEVVPLTNEEIKQFLQEE